MTTVLVLFAISITSSSVVLVVLFARAVNQSAEDLNDSSVGLSWMIAVLLAVSLVTATYAANGVSELYIPEARWISIPTPVVVPVPCAERSP